MTYATEEERKAAEKASQAIRHYRHRYGVNPGEPMPHATIYRIVCLPTGREYIGSTHCLIEWRWECHVSRMNRAMRLEMDPTPEGQAKFEKIFIPQAFLQDWKLFGEDQFHLQIIARLPGTTSRKDLGKVEAMYTAEAIEQKGRHMVYNQCLGNHKSPKALKMMSESNLGKPKSAEQRKKMSESHKARWAAMKAEGYQRPDKGRVRGPRKSAPQHP